MSDEAATTKRKILEAAIRALDEGGQSALRIIAVARDAGVSQGMIRYYFGDRESLVAEAMATRFIERYGFMLDTFTELTARCATQFEFRKVIENVLKQVYVADRSHVRLERNSDIGMAKDHPQLAEQIARGRDGLCADLAAVFESARQRGLTRADVDPMNVAALYLSFAHGISLWELGPESVTREALVATFQASLFALLFD